MIALSDLLATAEPRPAVAYHQGRYYRFDEFRASVAAWSQRLSTGADQAYALYYEDAYPFAVLLFALLHAGKEVWLSGNNRPGTAELLERHGCRLLGDWPGGSVLDEVLQPVNAADIKLMPLNQERARLVLFTSGSTGEAKPVIKSLDQLQIEIDTLERQWGERLADAEALATVSHQHIYGLLFRVLWPLSAGRCFHSRMAISPEDLLSQSDKAYWIASPAHLKRLDEQTPWHELSRLKAIFSSGGPLPAIAARRIFSESSQAAIEVYGSTETGGIAWRQQPDPAWSLFAGMSLIPTGDGMLLHSPYLLEHEGFNLDDRIEFQADGRFLLQGRRDRIVKIEEKRLSLTEMEQRLSEMSWIEEALVLTLEKSRDTVAAVLVLSAEGREVFKTRGRKRFIGEFREVLHRWFDAVVLPRKWLFLTHLPLSRQGKVETRLLKDLLDSDPHKAPQLQICAIDVDSAELQLKVPADLQYFPGHFADYPILPGVVQIAWAEHFGKILFPITKGFSHMEAIKFVKPIQPGFELSLKLHWKAGSGKLYFDFASAEQAYSSGRMVYH